MKRIVKCTSCGKEVKVGNYGIKAKKNKKNIYFKNIYEDGIYRCAVCRGPVTPKKSKRVRIENNADTTRGDTSK